MQNFMLSDVLDREATHTRTLEEIVKLGPVGEVARAMRVVNHLHNGTATLTSDAPGSYFGSEICADAAPSANGPRADVSLEGHPDSNPADSTRGSRLALSSHASAGGTDSPRAAATARAEATAGAPGPSAESLPWHWDAVSHRLVFQAGLRGAVFGAKTRGAASATSAAALRRPRRERASFSIHVFFYLRLCAPIFLHFFQNWRSKCEHVGLRMA